MDILKNNILKNKCSLDKCWYIIKPIIKNEFLVLFFLLGFLLFNFLFNNFSFNLISYAKSLNDSYLYKYILNQVFVINNEKYVINSFGNLNLGINKNFVDIKVIGAKYIIYKQVDKDLIKMSYNLYREVNSRLYRNEQTIFKSFNNTKFDTYFYPLYYVGLFYFIDKYQHIEKKLLLNESVLLINQDISQKKDISQKEISFSFIEIYKNEVINKASIFITKNKDNNIKSLKLKLKYEKFSKKDINFNMDKSEVDIKVDRMY